ncbi:hypothetical protein B0H13DRAFT_2054050 [Mycena leptocephala]|nr:hypothetical protein B0H13DRAFT_2054050 [Mycena leptocephala]
MMHIAFIPHPPVPPFGTEWMTSGRTLPYGPFQPIHRPIPDNAAQQSFECDPVIWQLWVEFHQKIRPIVTQRFPALDEMPTSDIWRHMVDAQHHLPSLTKFRDRLVDHLGRSGVLAVPLAASSWDRWLFVLRIVKRKFPNPAMEGPMHQTKLWVCIVHELSEFYVPLVRRQKEFGDRLKLEDLFFVYGLQFWKRFQECFSRDPSSFSYNPGQWSQPEDFIDLPDDRPTRTSESDPPAILIADYEPRRLNSRIIRRNIHRQSLDVDM